MAKPYTRYQLSQQIEKLKRQLSCGKIKSYTQAEIDALSPSCPTLVYNTDTDSVQVWNGTTWLEATDVPDNIIVSDTTGVAGADQIVNIISLTQAEYDAIVSPAADTLYVITD